MTHLDIICGCSVCVAVCSGAVSLRFSRDHSRGCVGVSGSTAAPMTFDLSLPPVARVGICNPSLLIVEVSGSWLGRHQLPVTSSIQPHDDTGH